jgi:hypothetical protein
LFLFGRGDGLIILLEFFLSFGDFFDKISQLVVVLLLHLFVLVGHGGSDGDNFFFLSFEVALKVHDTLLDLVLCGSVVVGKLLFSHELLLKFLDSVVEYLDLISVFIRSIPAFFTFFGSHL